MSLSFSPVVEGPSLPRESKDPESFAFLLTLLKSFALHFGHTLLRARTRGGLNAPAGGCRGLPEQSRGFRRLGPSE